MNRRRKLLLTLGTALLPPLRTRAQPRGRVYRVGYLLDQPLIEPPTPERAAFLRRLRELGYLEGTNLAIEYRSSESDPVFLPKLAAELAAKGVDVIVALAENSLRAAMKATRTIPIVFISGIDPVRGGIARSLARPGGNVTGITLLIPELEPKRLELLRELLPRGKRVAMLQATASTRSSGPRPASPMVAAASQLGFTLELHETRDINDLMLQLEKIAASRPDALLVVSDERLIAARRIIAEFALAQRLPSVMGVTDYAQQGGLAAYATNIPEQFGRLANYVDRILKGAKPGELPIEQPTKFDLVVNMKTAKAIGVTIPQSVLLRADRVIE